MKKQQIWIDKLECYLKKQDLYQQSRCHCCCVYVLCNRSKYNWDLEHKMRRNYRNHRSFLQYKLATSLSLCHTLRMGLQFKLLVIGVFLALALSFCEAKNATVKVVGLIHCTDCIKNQPSSSNASSSGVIHLLQQSYFSSNYLLCLNSTHTHTRLHLKTVSVCIYIYYIVSPHRARRVHNLQGHEE